MLHLHYSNQRGTGGHLIIFRNPQVINDCWQGTMTKVQGYKRTNFLQRAPAEKAHDFWDTSTQQWVESQHWWCCLDRIKILAAIPVEHRASSGGKMQKSMETGPSSFSLTTHPEHWLCASPVPAKAAPNQLVLPLYRAWLWALSQYIKGCSAISHTLQSNSLYCLSPGLTA